MGWPFCMRQIWRGEPRPTDWQSFLLGSDENQHRRYLDADPVAALWYMVVIENKRPLQMGGLY